MSNGEVRFSVFFKIDRIHYSMFDVGRSMFDVHYSLFDIRYWLFQSFFIDLTGRFFDRRQC